METYTKVLYFSHGHPLSHLQCDTDSHVDKSLRTRSRSQLCKSFQIKHGHLCLLRDIHHFVFTNSFKDHTQAIGRNWLMMISGITGHRKESPIMYRFSSIYYAVCELDDGWKPCVGTFKGFRSSKPLSALPDNSCLSVLFSYLSDVFIEKINKFHLHSNVTHTTCRKRTIKQLLINKLKKSTDHLFMHLDMVLIWYPVSVFGWSWQKILAWISEEEQKRMRLNRICNKSSMTYHRISFSWTERRHEAKERNWDTEIINMIHTFFDLSLPISVKLNY